jgi:hypothetical protein
MILPRTPYVTPRALRKSYAQYSAEKSGSCVYIVLVIFFGVTR